MKNKFNDYLDLDGLAHPCHNHFFSYWFDDKKLTFLKNYKIFNIVSIAKAATIETPLCNSANTCYLDRPV